MENPLQPDHLFFFLSDCYTDEKRVLDHYLAAKQIPFHTTLTQIVWHFFVALSDIGVFPRVLLICKDQQPIITEALPHLNDPTTMFYRCLM